MSRGPKRSVSQPEGTWLSAYVQKNALSIQPTWLSVRPRSSLIKTSAKEMQNRSRYNSTAIRAVTATTR